MLQWKDVDRFSAFVKSKCVGLAVNFDGTPWKLTMNDMVMCVYDRGDVCN